MQVFAAAQAAERGAGQLALLLGEVVPQRHEGEEIGLRLGEATVRSVGGLLSVREHIRHSPIRLRLIEPRSGRDELCKITSIRRRKLPLTETVYKNAIDLGAHRIGIGGLVTV